ncbi:MAG: hypothetical protein ACRDV3_09775 [Acidothermaceae bacterium]
MARPTSVAADRGGDLAALPRAELEARFARATSGASLRPLPERLGAVSDAELVTITQRLARRQHECGCSAGASAMWVAAVIAIVGGVVRGASSLDDGLALVGVGVAFVVAVTIAAKFCAIAVSRSRWRRDRDAVIARLATSKGAGHVVVR